MSESLDRNKTVDTHVATATVAAWLDALGCKPVETEVSLDAGWVADLATFWTPTLTESRKARLLRDIFPEHDRREVNADMESFYHRVGGRVTIAVEVKTSRADFLKDKGRKYGGIQDKRPTLDPPAHVLIVAAPAGVVNDNELHGVGHLCLSADCTRVTKWRGPWYLNAQHPHQIETLIAEVAIRRDHNTRYAAARRFWKAYRQRYARPQACAANGEKEGK